MVSVPGVIYCGWYFINSYLHGLFQSVYYIICSISIKLKAIQLSFQFIWLIWQMLIIFLKFYFCSMNYFFYNQLPNLYWLSISWQYYLQYYCLIMEILFDEMKISVFSVLSLVYPFKCFFPHNVYFYFWFSCFLPFFLKFNINSFIFFFLGYFFTFYSLGSIWGFSFIHWWGIPGYMKNLHGEYSPFSLLLHSILQV